jgi:hypothetical protein
MKRAMAVFAIISVVLIGCGDLSLQPDKNSFHLDNDQGTGSGKSFKIAVPIPKLAVDNVAKVEYLLTGTDMEDLRGELVIGGDDVARGAVRGVKAGNSRTVTLNALNSSGVITYTGSSVMNVTAGETTSVNVVMKATNVTDGDVKISGTFEEEDEVSGIELNAAILRAEELLGFWRFNFTLLGDPFPVEYHLQSLSDSMNENGEFVVNGVAKNNAGVVLAGYSPDTEKYLLVNITEDQSLAVNIYFTISGYDVEGEAIVFSYDEGTEDYIEQGRGNLASSSGRISGFSDDSGTVSGKTTLAVSNQVDDGDYTYTIYELYISPSSADTWGPNLLGDQVLGFGESIAFEIEPGIYDLRAIDEEGDEYILTGAQIGEDGGVWEVTFDLLVDDE